VHGRSGKNGTKFRLYPDVRVAYSSGYDRRTVLELFHVAPILEGSIENTWNAFFR